MRKNYYLISATSFILYALLTGCSGSETQKPSVTEIISEGNMENILTKKKELTTSIRKIESEIAQLDLAINSQSETKNLSLITALKTSEQNFVHFIELQGNVTTQQNVLVYPEVGGVMRKVYIKEGTRVKKGQLLASITNGGIKNQLIQMKTQLSLMKTTYERQKRLWDQKIGSEIQYLQTKTSYESQKSAVAQITSQLSKYDIRAPFTGVIDEIFKDQGTVVGPGGQGSEIFRIINLSEMYVEVFVPEKYITTVTQGKKVNVFFPVLNETIESRIDETGIFINPNNRSFVVKIPVPNKSGNVKPNLTARVYINDYQKEKAILIPQSVISENADGEQYVYKVINIDKDNVALSEKIIITTGKTQEDMIEVLTGIVAGENIIIEGARSVKDGQEVKILNY